MILLDTHIWIWINTAARLLPASVREGVEDGEAFAISAISVWETMLLLEKKRLEVAGLPNETVRKWIAANPIEIIDLTVETTILARSMPFQHDDPADRFIAATAYRLGVPLATTDERLRRLPWLKSL